MTPSNRTATHPGKILLKEYLESMGITQKGLAAHIGISEQRVNKIVRGKRGITPKIAWLLSDAFRTTPELWLNLQSIHDLSVNRPDRHVQPLISAD